MNEDNPTAPTPPRGLWRRALPIAGAAAILALLVRAVDGSDVARAIRALPLGLLLGLQAVSSFVDLVLGTDKWWRQCRAMGTPIPWRDALWLRLGPRPIKFLLPLRSGELIQAVWLDRRGRMPFPTAVGSLLFEKVVNLLGLLVWMTLGLALYAPPWLWAGPAAACAAGLFVYFRGERLGPLLLAPMRRIGDRTARFAEGLFGAFEKIPPGARLWLLLYGVLYQVWDWALVVILLREMGADAPWLAAAGYVPLADVIASLPVTISGVGLREGALVAFMGAMATPEQVLVAGLGVSTLVYIAPAVVGAPFTVLFLRQLAGPRRAPAAEGTVR